MPLIFYSVCAVDDLEATRIHLEQLYDSVESLRRYNATLPLYVFAFGLKKSQLAELQEFTRVTVIEKPQYADALHNVCGRYSEAFRFYPVLHRWLAIADLVGCGEDSLLYADCDTVFLSDPVRLFEQHAVADWYAREEPYSSSSHLGYDPDYLDERVLRVLARRKGVRFLPPVNIGVVLMNHRVWERLPGILEVYFREMWSFAVWLSRFAGHGGPTSSRFGAFLQHVSKIKTEEDVRRSSPYPSSNMWILDQIGLLFALGGLEQFTCGFLDRDLVLQGNEFSTLSGCGASAPVLCHYYSKNRTPFFEWHRNYIEQETGSRPLTGCETVS